LILTDFRNFPIQIITNQILKIKIKNNSMKKSVITVFAIIIALVNVAKAQTLSEVLDKHFKAVGQEKMMAVNSFYIKAKVSQMGMEMPMEMKIKKPDMFIMTVEMQGQKMIQAFDGQKGWMIAPWVSTDPQELSGAQLTQAKDQVNMEGELYNYEKKGSTAELGGKVNVDGKEVYRIKLTSKDGDAKDYFIDTNTYLISKVKAKVSAQGQTVDVEQIMSEYKTIDGITMAMKIESKSPMGTALIIMEEVKFNEKFDDAIFKQPAK
jgi:phage-related holin